MRLVSHLSRAIRRLGLSNTQFADQAGVARSTIQKLIGRDFKEIRVDTIERIAARLRITDIGELFSLQDDSVDFLAPFSENRSVTFVFGTHDVTDAPLDRPDSRRTAAIRTTVDMWDVRAQTRFLAHVRSHFPDIRDQTAFFSRESFGPHERSRVLEIVESQNTVIVGSPKVNPACEAVLREIFPALKKNPTDLERGPRLRLAEKDRMSHSILGIGGYEEVGVVDVSTGKMIAQSRFAGKGETSVDAGILLAVFRPRRTNERVSLVIAAGITGCGTCGAIEGLIRNPPRAEDLDSGRPWVKAFQTYYSKHSDSRRDDRRIERVVPAEE